MKNSSIHIIGAGLVGSLLAIFLARQGHRVHLLEKATDPRNAEYSGGRSINLALSERGMHALRQVDLLDAVLAKAVPMRGRMVHQADAKPTLQPYGNSPHEVIYSVHRRLLNNQLLDAAEQAGVQVRFEHALTDIDLDDNLLKLTQGDDLVEETFDVVIGADGAGSQVRNKIEEIRGFQALSDMLDHGYKELFVAADDNGDHQLDANALHIWPHGGFMMIALPNADGSFTNTLFMPHQDHPASFSALKDPAAVGPFFADKFADAVPLLPDLNEQFSRNPIGHLGTLRCAHWHVSDKLCLIGDAAHAIVPFHGQGMNAGFEDCSVFALLVEAIGPNWQQVFDEFEQMRMPQAKAIADMALENYIEMRSSVADPGYQLRRQLEQELERRMPEIFVPRYSMVMFHRIPYAEAQWRGNIQQDILQQACAGKSKLSDVDMPRAEATVKRAPLPFPPHRSEVAVGILPNRE